MKRDEVGGLIPIKRSLSQSYLSLAKSEGRGVEKISGGEGEGEG